MEIIDRRDELARLRAAADAPPQLVVIRGRRRVGKSFLATAALGDRRSLFFQADEQDERGHLDLLAREASEIVPGRPPLRFDGWDQALSFLGDQAAVAPLVVVLDEFQWLWDAQPALDSLVQRHWDAWQRARTPITLILSGSSLIHMTRLLEPERPLYGRADYRPLLMPLDYRWAAGFAGVGPIGPAARVQLDAGDAESLLRRYAVLGGTPQYQVWGGPGPILEVIERRILATGESLYEEPLHLLREERAIRSPGSYFEIMRAVAAGATKHNEIAQQARIETAALPRMLARLMDLGYLALSEPLEHRGFASRRGVYRIRDPFFRFWFRYVLPNRSRLERGRVAEVLAAVAADLDTYMGLAFEDCCREWAGRYADGLPTMAEVGSWWDRRGRTEIDLVGTAKGRYVVVGTCKWDTAADARVLGRLRRDAEALGAPAARARMVVFARGFADDLVAEAARDGVRLVEARELF
jgi:AAA+ ATPase superfamily predicted ATPase